jgi:hypothetical protein
MINRNSRVYPKRVFEKVLKDYNKVKELNPKYFKNVKILVGHKGEEYLTPGYVYAPYVPMYVTATVLPADKNAVVLEDEILDPVEKLMKKIGYEIRKRTNS